ncbi:hypothetical protein [Phenylobacterium kunshanense]|uniref:Uncharacterized protein n=1 Tax=Phenylobacterium kunshanense TaxID=1445034 RepID=A0A328B6T6_9CAUL|nr:hypothetical protein [Phenylobacterium kunshanense]RAK62803.1 hypothetical protein DJ019_18275 [Phenylobacterium kunshanense]
MPANATEDRILRLGAALAGVIFMVGAALAWEMARAHMALLGTICGAGPHPHCGWCYGAASLVLAGLAGFAYAARPNGNAGLLQIKARP